MILNRLSFSLCLVQAKITLVSQRRGDLQIMLTSPTGTRSTLLARRPHDISRAGFDSWPFMSVHTWGEQPFGVWQLDIHNEGRYLGTYSAGLTGDGWMGVGGCRTNQCLDESANENMPGSRVQQLGFMTLRVVRPG